MAAATAARVRELIGNRPLSARSVLASALLGSDEGRLTVAELVAIASLFDVSDGAARTCLWRMVSNGELTGDDGSYALAGRLLDRRQRVDEASRIARGGAWDGTWELAIVALERRSAADRLELRKAATALHLAELREGVWIRPDNLDPQRLPAYRSVLDRQCTHFHRAVTAIGADKMRALFALDDWASDATALIEAMDTALDNNANGAHSIGGIADKFALSVAAIRHLQRDPQLPVELVADHWPGDALRRTYRRFDDALKRRMNNAFSR